MNCVNCKTDIIWVVLYYNIQSKSIIRLVKYDWNRKQDVIITRWVRLASTPGGGVVSRSQAVKSAEWYYMRLFALSPHCIIYFFGLFRARPTVLHTTLNGHLDTGVPPAALVYNIVDIYIYIIIMDLSDCVHKHIWSQRMCGRYINGTARFIISFALTPNRTHGIPYIIFFPNTISSFIICRPFPLNFILLFFTYPNPYI